MRGNENGIKVQTPASPNIENDHRALPLLAPKGVAETNRRCRLQLSHVKND